MASVLIPLASGFEELEAVTIIDLLRRAEIEVTVAGLSGPEPVTGSRGTTIVPDVSLEDVMDIHFDMITLPGGLPGADNLDRDIRIHRLLQSMQQQGRFVSAICAAPRVLANAGVLSGKRATGYPGHLEKLQRVDIELVDQAVVVDGRVITSKGPGTAMEFSLCLIEQLCGKTRRDQVEGPLQGV
ncbi:MAG: DJ-1/PfpI family protein [Gammaproteobacteria bacterium]|nr:DJ-1/PfpI family protein [Gammaproteobacteria bacterium]